MMNVRSYLKGIESKLVRDLVSCLLSPCPVNERSQIPLVSDEEKMDWFNEHRHLIDEWGRKDELYRKTVLSYLKNNRLGYYFEALFLAFFHLSPYVEVVLSNHQVILNKATLGEIDLVILKGKELIHLELSIKFYLQHQKSELFENWLGPNGKDDFLKKRNKLIDQQLKMTNHIDIADKKKLKSKALICGQFYQKSSELLPWQGELTEKRIYLHHKELNNFLAENGIEKVYLLTKPNWFSDQLILDEALATDVNSTLFEKIDEGHQMKKAILLGLLLNDIYQTLFVVPNAWPTLP